MLDAITDNPWEVTLTIDELKEKLNKLNDPDLESGLMELIDSERQRGIAEVSKRNKENQTLRQKYKSIFEEAGVENEDELREFINGKRMKSTEDNSLSLKSINNELNRVKTELSNERLKTKQSELDKALTTAIGDKVFGSRYLIKSLISDNIVDKIDGEIVFKFGDEHVSFDQGVQRVLDDNKDALRTNIAGGSKTTKSASKVSDINSIIQANDPDTVKANFAEIAKELKLKV